MSEEEVVSTGDNPWKIILSLLRDYPEDWVVNQYDWTHTPSGCELKYHIKFPFNRVGIDSMGEHHASWLWTRRIRKEVRQIIAERMLATSRQKLLVPEKYVGNETSYDWTHTPYERSARLRKNVRDARKAQELGMLSENPFGTSILKVTAPIQDEINDATRYMLDGHYARRKSKKES